jgi:3-deoxy-D-manno-octulosonic-acid transferase
MKTNSSFNLQVSDALVGIPDSVMYVLVDQPGSLSTVLNKMYAYMVIISEYEIYPNKLDTLLNVPFELNYVH